MQRFQGLRLKALLKKELLNRGRDPSIVEGM